MEGGEKTALSVLEGQLDVPAGFVESARTDFLGVGVGLTFFFLGRGRVDPYITGRLGYTRTRLRFDDVFGNEYSETVSRGSVRLGGGFDVFLGRYVGVGPRFDVTVGFSGRVCAEGTGGGEDSSPPDFDVCYPTRNLEESARIYAQDLPVPVFVGGQVRVVIPWSVLRA